MFKDKRVIILCGHYGSGKTNIAVNLALHLKKQREKLALADLDIVNPYFRAEDSRAELEKNGIEMICSEYANSNLDIPALPQQMYSITDNLEKTFIIDVGGDDRGAYALGRLSDKILAENNYAMLMVVNKFRPLTPDVKSTLDVMREIETVSKIPFNGIVNNSNLGPVTTETDVTDSLNYAFGVAEAADIPLVMTTVKYDLFDKLNGKVENLFALNLQKKIIDTF